jgi:hypothetical protein
VLAALVSTAAIGSARAAPLAEHHPRGGFNQRGNLLIADQFSNRVIETDKAGHIVWSFGLGPKDFSANSIIGVNDVQRVGPFTLMAGTGTPASVIPEAPDGAPDNRVMVGDYTGLTPPHGISDHDSD